MAVTTLTTNATEESVYAITVSWLDEDGSPVTPSAATWTLVDSSGNVINSRSAVTISSLSTSNTIVLSGDDLAVTQAHDFQREVVFIFTYTSATLGAVTGKQAVRFTIDNLWGVT